MKKKNVPIFTHERGGARLIEHRAAAVGREDLRHHHAQTFRRAPRALEIPRARVAVQMLVARRHDGALTARREPRGARESVGGSRRGPFDALQRGETVAAARRRDARRAVCHFSPVVQQRRVGIEKVREVEGGGERLWPRESVSIALVGGWECRHMKVRGCGGAAAGRVRRCKEEQRALRTSASQRASMTPWGVVSRIAASWHTALVGGWGSGDARARGCNGGAAAARAERSSAAQERGEISLCDVPVRPIDVVGERIASRCRSVDAMGKHGTEHQHHEGACARGASRRRRRRRERRRRDHHCLKTFACLSTRLAFKRSELQKGQLDTEPLFRLVESIKFTF